MAIYTRPVKKLIFWLDRKTPLMLILLLFWASFWGLNGLDKFFDGSSEPNLESTKGVLVDSDGEIALKLYSVEPQGFFGVSRDNKMVHYCQRLHLPRGLALTSLYGFAIIECMLGLGFFVLVVWSLLPRKTRLRKDGLWELFSARVIHRLCFKGGLAVFLVFCVGDILFGDRMELWEHGTFMILTLVTYDMWYRTDQFMVQTAASGEAAKQVGRLSDEPG